MDAAALRAEFPVLERLAYLNAGTDGPVPAEAAAPPARRSSASSPDGRYGAALRGAHGAPAALRALYAGVLGCAAEDVALHHLDQRGPRRRARRDGPRAGRRDRDLRQRAPRPARPAASPRATAASTVRTVPLRDVADAVGAAHDAGRLLARRPGSPARSRPPRSPSSTCRSCSTAPRAPARSRSTSRARAARPTPRPARSGCAAPTGPGCSTSRPAFRERCARSRPSYMSLRRTPRRARRAAARDAPAATTRRRSRARRSRSRSPRLACSTAPGSTPSTPAPPALAARSPSALAERGRTVAPRGDTTLVAWEDADPPATRDRARRGRRRRPRPARHAVTCAPRSARGTTSRDLERLLARAAAPQRHADALQPGLPGQHPLRRGLRRRRRRLEPRALVVRQLESTRAEQVLELRERARPDDRRRHALHAEQPRDRDLRHGRAVRRGDLLGGVDRPGSCARPRAGGWPPRGRRARRPCAALRHRSPRR